MTAIIHQLTCVKCPDEGDRVEISSRRFFVKKINNGVLLIKKIMTTCLAILTERTTVTQRDAYIERNDDILRREKSKERHKLDVVKANELVVVSVWRFSVGQRATGEKPLDLITSTCWIGMTGKKLWLSSTPEKLAWRFDASCQSSGVDDSHSFLSQYTAGPNNSGTKSSRYSKFQTVALLCRWHVSS